ncbi:MAG: RNA 2'-phosphotransferase [Planctomycetes bacterium]|nr:RNA 2'-phosphotransferase [Planctomycetota bacterium]
MERKQLTRISRRLSWLLRHGARETGLAMDAAGWVAVEEVLRFLALEPAALRQVVEQDEKSCLQWVGDRLRACQGHSTAGTPVTAGALEQSWQPYEGPGPLWHGTSLAALPQIARDGLRPMERTHVHLAAATESKVGKRAQVDVLLRVDLSRLYAHGLRVFASPNGVLLVRCVPAEAITGIASVSAAARERHHALLPMFGLVAEQ